MFCEYRFIRIMFVQGTVKCCLIKTGDFLVKVTTYMGLDTLCRDHEVKSVEIGHTCKLLKY